MDIPLDERTRKLLEASQDPKEIAQLCLAAGLASGQLATDGLGNVVVANAENRSAVTEKPRIDFEDRTRTDNDGNLPPERLEYLKK